MISQRVLRSTARSLLQAGSSYAERDRNPVNGLIDKPALNNSSVNGSAICLLDDDPSVLKATGRLLSSAGREVRSFTDPHAFLNYAQTQHPRLAILDMLMPLMHGLDVQRRLQNVSPTTRVIILTSKDDPFVRSQAMEAGAAGFFLKPVNDEEFLSGVDAILAKN